MHLSKIRIRNFRRLVDAKIDLDKEISIFVGANNSGKTSVAQAMHIFIAGNRDRFSIHDISACKWSDIEDFSRDEGDATLPVVTLDLWFEVGADDLHRVIDLLPNLEWQEELVGLRIVFAPQNEHETLARFRERQQEAQQAATDALRPEHARDYIAPPRTLTEFLEGELKREYEFRYFVLDAAQFDEELEPVSKYVPLELMRDEGRTGKDIVNSLFKIDFLPAQRHLSDSAGGSRAEELSRLLSRYYAHNLERHAEDFNALRVLAESEGLLNEHLQAVFAETLRSLAQLGYPGFSNPKLVIKSALNPATVMNSQDGAHVHYALNEDGVTLPDKYSGLGFKNLVYMVVELLDLHAQWLAIEDGRPPLHLVFVEEPEAHLHAQLQQVFVNKILDILADEDDELNAFRTQLVLTTHSPHILYERGFRPIRYFRRENTGEDQSSCVLNLSELYEMTENPNRDFLERYLKLTHCDLFFADGAVLVEGNVERLLVPQMIEMAAPGLRSTYLTVLEIGGAFSHRFETLMEFLGITTLIITDLDSVYGPTEAKASEEQEAGESDNDEPDEEDGRAPGRTCTPETEGAVTSNQTLQQWLPRKLQIDELLCLGIEDKTVAATEDRPGAVRVTYPTTVELKWGNERISRAGRTLEAAFAYENLEWTQKTENYNLGLRVRNPHNIEDLAQRLHNKIHGSNFKKTDFALTLLAKDRDCWDVPSYIKEGLQWLESELHVAEQQIEPAEDGGV